MSEIKILKLYSPISFVGNWSTVYKNQDSWSYMVEKIYNHKAANLNLENDEYLYFIENNKIFSGREESISNKSDYKQTLSKAEYLFWQVDSIKSISKSSIKSELSSFAIWKNREIISTIFIREIVENKKSQYQFIVKIKKKEHLF